MEFEKAIKEQEEMNEKLAGEKMGELMELANSSLPPEQSQELRAFFQRVRESKQGKAALSDQEERMVKLRQELVEAKKESDEAQVEEDAARAAHVCWQLQQTEFGQPNPLAS